MSPRAKLSIPFGGGLDRKTGATVVDPDAFADLRNVYLFKGRTMLRKGLARVLDIGWGTDIVGIFSVRAQGLAAVIVFDDISLDVRLYMVDGELETASLVGTLWTLDPACELPPTVTGADLYDHLVLAHGEAVFAVRGATRVLDALTFTLADYTADLDRDTVSETVRARVVAKHLNSLILGGYGTGADEDRPETLRFSKPGFPLVLIPESYFFVGNKGDPILAFGRSGSYLEVMKVAETHFFIGNGPKNFDIIPGDDSHGIAGMRLYTNIGDVLYRWSLDGPRVSRGGTSDDLELPLNLEGPLPDATAGETEGFAYYDATRGEVVFVFDAWGYALHLKDGTKRWSYREFGVVLQSAGRIYEGGTATLSLAEAILGSLSTVSDADPVDPEPVTTVPWVISGTLTGGEDVEVWVKPNYGALPWALAATVPATDLTADVALSYWLTNHAVAVRVVISGSPGAGYTGSPDLWPATARDTTYADLALTAVVQGAWDRKSNIRPARDITFTGPGMGGAHPELTFVLEYSSDAGGSWHASTGSPLAAIPLFDEHLNADVNVTTYRNRLKVVGPDGDTGYFDGASDTLFQPKAPFNLSASADLGGSGTGHIHHCDCTNAETGGVMELRGRHLPIGTHSAFVPITPGVGADLDVAGGATLGTPGVNDGNLELEARLTITAFGVNDRTSTIQDMGLN